uniref:Uncharacterized protein n=1 Tax=Vitis vinifera TaxID=29760 RepID=F6HS82_VITVI
MRNMGERVVSLGK